MVRQNSASESTQNNSQNPAFNTNGLTHHMEQTEHQQETPKELSDSQIFEKIEQAMREHTPGANSGVRYDVKNEHVYTVMYHGNSWDQDEDGYIPYEIFTIPNWADDSDIRAMLGCPCDEEQAREYVQEYEDMTVDDFLDIEKILPTIIWCELEEYAEILDEIEEARKQYAEFSERQN